jgi:hypothetical protein
LAHKLAAARADGGTHRHFALPRGRSGEQQIGAGDQQHKAYGPQEH